MGLENIYFISEIIAALAVVISIVYLGIQIRNTRIQNKKDIYIGMSKFRSELTLKLASDKELSYIVAQGLSAKSKMNPNEYFRFSNFAFTYFVSYEMVFQRNLSKDINADIAEAVEDSLFWWLSFPGVQAFWKNNSEFGFSPKFKDYINELIKQVNSKPSELIRNQVDFMESAGKRMNENITSSEIENQE